MTNTKQTNREIKEKVAVLRNILKEKKLLAYDWSDKELILMLLDIEIKRLTK